MTRIPTCATCVWLLLALVVPSSSAAQGRFEFGVHYGAWSVNLLKPVAEGFTDDFAAEVKDSIVESIQKEYPRLRETGFANQVEFDSSGNNFGVEARWYPGGAGGSFSLGIAAEKSSMRIGVPGVTTAVSLQDSATGARYAFDGRASGQIETKPFAVLMTLRWDIIPSRRVNPYFSIGVGAAGAGALDKTTVVWNYTGTLTAPGVAPDAFSEASQKTLGQLKIENDFDYPIGVFPFVQVNLGLKVKATKTVHLLVDGGVLNGFVLRGGIAVRM